MYKYNAFKKIKTIDNKKYNYTVTKLKPIKNNTYICNNCKNKLNKKYNYCPKCSVPLVWTWKDIQG